MTTKKLRTRIKAKIKRLKKQQADLDALNPNTISNSTARAVVKIARHTSKLLSYGRLAAYREILRETENKI